MALAEGGVSLRVGLTRDRRRLCPAEMVACREGSRREPSGLCAAQASSERGETERNGIPHNHGRASLGRALDPPIGS